MHTATRLAVELIEPVRRLNPGVHVCFYGLYAPMNESYLRGLGVETILGGEFEEGLSNLIERLPAVSSNAETKSFPGAGLRTPSARDPRGDSGGERRWQPEPVISLARLKFAVPDRSGLVPLQQYAHLILPGGEHRTVGYTEASRGCKHLCRHCPIVPVYNGTFRVVERAVVLEDIRRQVAAGAEHITFGDPDFFNGPGHAVAIVEALHAEHPSVTYDATIKIEHLLQYRDLLPVLKQTGCQFVTSAVESIDDAVLEKLAKGHTRADFIEVVGIMRKAGLTLAPTF